jgi:hypothetical protein
MEFDENNVVNEPEEVGEPVEIYSRRAIWWFSVFAPLVGGILLAINLYNAGFKKAIYGVLAFSLLYYFAVNLAVDNLVVFFHLNLAKVDVKNMDIDTQLAFIKIGAIGIGLNIIAGTILTRYFFKKYFPDNDYYPRSILQPLFITILVMLAMNYLAAMGG